MTTKRKTPPEDPLKPIRKLIDKIQKELSCTEAEAYFTIRNLATPPAADVRFSYMWLLAAQMYRKKKKCSKREASSFVAAHLELVQAISPWEWSVFNTQEHITQMEAYRKRVEGGDFAAFFRALGVCGFDGFPIPQWIQDRSEKAFSDYSRHKVVTTDDALGAKRPRYYRQDKARRDASNIPWDIFSLCRELLLSGGVTPDIFDTVAQAYGLSKTIVSNYYYNIRKALPMA